MTTDTIFTQFSRNDKTYVFPDFSGKPEVIVPSTEMRWLLDQVQLHR
jgi:hypothetical protein